MFASLHSLPLSIKIYVRVRLFVRVRVVACVHVDCAKPIYCMFNATASRPDNTRQQTAPLCVCVLCRFALDFIPPFPSAGLREGNLHSPDAVRALCPYIIGAVTRIR